MDAEVIHIKNILKIVPILKITRNKLICLLYYINLPIKML